ncbi:phosphonoacetaldehyde reductase [Candidatus Lucifugimonas marina]|uniref:Iron-containing alcohol dehydrogenase n=1 Tax=Candidatus Lucifugimonas marina TaxID=3038979 RepID=A0AAJ5ZEX6_9CHLR|nr:iron-containing alcohol dehydrogenase [SAR202 cluster bacterium JH702]MDG0868269.1 iron-containing alcohol dehydrogenase [SAR202 cluster bacterium JH639]WFG34913.1 iron-containing alcohol dehydrogenase [SAR202 cluster bacterium JH545]WFG38864.1 iron-containing alcohol dehydrogenase [SAR202 cluster bacterium JH1073]
MDDSTQLWEKLVETQIHFGAGTRNEVSNVVGNRKTLIVTTEGTISRKTLDNFFAPSDNRVVNVFGGVKSHSSLDDIESAAISLRNENYDCLLAIGGGTAIDTAKCFSILLNDRRPFRQVLTDTDISNATPIIAIPTTSGSGSEVTPFATVWDYQQKTKYSLATPLVRPEAAFIDPELLLSLPERTTISSGLDTVSHALESIWNRNATSETVQVATRALKLALDNLAKAVDQPNDLSTRTLMCEASMLAGIAISHTRTALAHSISYPLTAHLGLDHGIACSVTLPSILMFNYETDDGRLERLVTDLEYASIDALRRTLIDLFRSLDISRYLNRHSFSMSNLKSLQEKMVSPSRSDNNMREVDADSIGWILADTVEILAILES